MPKYFSWITVLIIILVIILVTFLFLRKPNSVSVNNTYPNNTITTATPTTTPMINITTSDLIMAGFSEVVQQQPANDGRFRGPNLYFTVQQNTTPNSPNGNIVMVMIANAGNLSSLPAYGSNIKPFNISSGTGQEGIMSDGRIAINFIKNILYVVIIGPGVSQVENLAGIVSTKPYSQLSNAIKL